VSEQNDQNKYSVYGRRTARVERNDEFALKEGVYGEEDLQFKTNYV
jgi:hypothetical protein